MDIKILKECGYEEAMLGLSLSHNQPVSRMPGIAAKLSSKDGGHNKFLESIYVWLDINAPRFWWQEADTYRLSTKQSESTMHTINKGYITQDDFEYKVGNLTVSILNSLIKNLNTTSIPSEKTELFLEIKNRLPEGFLQRRIWVMNYKCLRNIYQQRKNHKLIQWEIFCNKIKMQLEHPSYII